MSTELPSVGSSNEKFVGRLRGAAQDASKTPYGQSTETASDSPFRLPDRIGQYHIRRVLAAGGMGTVYEGNQERPRRVVAVKLMKQGITSRSALRRFEYEFEILATGASRYALWWAIRWVRRRAQLVSPPTSFEQRSPR